MTFNVLVSMASTETVSGGNGAEIDQNMNYCVRYAMRNPFMKF